MDDQDIKIPRFSYDLVTFLDEQIMRPDFPATANQFHALNEAEIRRAAFTAGARSIVDMLIEWRDEVEEYSDEEELQPVSVDDPTLPVFPRIFDTGGRVREDVSSVRMAPSTLGRELDD